MIILYTGSRLKLKFMVKADKPRRDLITNKYSPTVQNNAKLNNHHKLLPSGITTTDCVLGKKYR